VFIEHGLENASEAFVVPNMQVVNANRRLSIFSVELAIVASAARYRFDDGGFVYLQRNHSVSFSVLEVAELFCKQLIHVSNFCPTGVLA
jgi:hypothetical protein